MSERLIALADAADEACKGCKIGAAARNDVLDWKHIHDDTLLDPVCYGDGSRQIVEREHPGLGSKPTSEWRKL